MIYLELFWIFFITNIVGYGGGPAIVPLIQYEIVEKRGWLTLEDFSIIFSIGNSLPGPIATKLAGYIGFLKGGLLGLIMALFATVVPSLLLMLLLLKIIHRYRDSPKIKRMTLYIKPGISVLLGTVAISMWATSWKTIGSMQTLVLIICGFFFLEKFKMHPAFLILLALIYGAFFL